MYLAFELANVARKAFNVDINDGQMLNYTIRGHSVHEFDLL